MQNKYCVFCNLYSLKGTQAWDFTPLFFGINSCLGSYWSSVSTFLKFFFTHWGIILTLMLSALSGSARSEVCVDPDDGRPHSATTRTTDDLTLHRPGRRPTSLCVDLDDGRPHSAPTRTAQSDIKPLIPRPPPMNVLKIGDTIDHWPPGHEIMPKKTGVKSHACVPLKCYTAAPI